MKVIKISDEAYAQVCKIASTQRTYLSDALDLIVFGKVDILDSGTDEETETQQIIPANESLDGYLDRIFPHGVGVPKQESS